LESEMRKKHPPFTKTASEEAAIFVDDLPRLVDSWLLAGDINRHSARTIETRRERLGRLLWFLRHREFAACGLTELRAFFHYPNHGHEEPGGRWGNPRLTNGTSSGRVKSYHSTIRTFFGWLVEEGQIEATPMARIPPPVDRLDRIQPFTADQLKALLAAAKHGRANPRRDEAILLLQDTGIRASELCALTCSDVDLHGEKCLVREGKGGKSRPVPFSHDTKRALYHYLNEREWEADAPLFLSEGGNRAGDGLTR
jgi:site-specific recombinase XerD